MCHRFYIWKPHILNSSIIYLKEIRLIIITTLKHYWGDIFWRNNAIFLTGSLFVAFINYLYHPILGRILEVSSFGEVQVLLSIFNVFGMMLVAFQVVIINISANNSKASVETVQQFERLALVFMALVFTLIAVNMVNLQNFFNFDSSLPFLVLGVGLMLSVLAGLRQAYVQGKTNFKAVSISSGIGALGKLVFSVIFIFVGFKTLGAIAGIVLAQILAYWYIARAAKLSGYVTATTNKFTLPRFTLLKPELRYLLTVMTVFFIVTLLYSGDILVVKRFFSPEIAGQYAGVSAIAKIIFFATASFAGVLLASVGQAYSTAHNKQIIRKSLALVMIGGGIAWLLFSLFPEFVVSLMLGNRYAAYAYLLPSLSLVIFLLSIVNLCFYYFLALRRYIVLPIAIVGGLVTFSFTIIKHDTLEVVIQNFLVGSVSVLLLLASVQIFYRLRASRGVL